MLKTSVRMICCAMAFAAATPLLAQNAQNPVQSAPLPSYAIVASRVIAAPLVIDTTIRNATRVKPAEAPGLAPGFARFYVEAQVQALIRGASSVPAQIAFLTDVPLDAKGKPPKLKKQRVIVFARPLEGRPGTLQLTGRQSQFNWSPQLDALVRAISKDVLAADAPPAIRGVGSAFHVPGSLPGEGETQIFLTTSTDAQISLQVLRRPGERPRWSVSTGDFIDESAGAPAKDTLLWYRLACGLPRTLPAEVLESGEPGNARVAREDYQTVLRELGPCA
jgi:hypothetical protein